MNEKRKEFLLKGQAMLDRLTKSYLLNQGLSEDDIYEMIENSILEEIEIPVCSECIREIESTEYYEEDGCKYCGNEELDFFLLPYYQYHGKAES